MLELIFWWSFLAFYYCLASQDPVDQVLQPLWCDQPVPCFPSRFYQIDFCSWFVIGNLKLDLLLQNPYQIQCIVLLKTAPFDRGPWQT